MENILYREVMIETGVFKNTQIQITFYADRFEFEYSNAMSRKELYEIQRNISYVKKEIVYYDKVTDYSRAERCMLEKVTAYQFFFRGDFEVEKAGKRKKTGLVSIQTMDRRLWDAFDLYTPLVPTEEQKKANLESLQNAITNPSVVKGMVEIETNKGMVKYMRLFINDMEWKDYTHPPVRFQLPFGTYRIKIASGVPDLDFNEINYFYSDEVTITLSEGNPVVYLVVKMGFTSPILKFQNE